MSIRIVSGVIGTIFVIALLFLNEKFLLLINLLLALIAEWSVIEIFTAMGMEKFLFITIPTIMFVPMLPIVGYGFFGQVCWYLYTIVILGVMLFDTKIGIKNISLLYMMAIIITVSFSKIVEIRDFGQQLGNFYVLLTLAVAWTSDTGAYFCGKYFGKRKLCPKISPRKTIEGFCGGVITCILSMLLIGFIFENFVFHYTYRVNYFWLILLGILGSPISTLGDLCFSVIKRNCNVKDFGNVIPGHGGVLDRFDSVIFVAPYAYLFFKLIPVIKL